MYIVHCAMQIACIFPILIRFIAISSFLLLFSELVYYGIIFQLSCLYNVVCVPIKVLFVVQKSPTRPGVLVLLSGPGEGPSSSCLMENLLRTGAKYFSETDYITQDFMINGSLITNSSQVIKISKRMYCWYIVYIWF